MLLLLPLLLLPLLLLMIFFAAVNIDVLAAVAAADLAIVVAVVIASIDAIITVVVASAFVAPACIDSAPAATIVIPVAGVDAHTGVCMCMCVYVSARELKLRGNK